MAASPNEYGFYANVNPAVPHPRWSQATERRIGELSRRQTLPFNGYTDKVASLYTGRRVRPDTAMTGEITLSGLVFPVGGIKEKVLAAYRAGIRRIIMPSRNEDDAAEIPEEVRKDLQIVFVSRISEAIDAALEVLVANPPPPLTAEDLVARDRATRQPEPQPIVVQQAK